MSSKKEIDVTRYKFYNDGSEAIVTYVNGILKDVSFSTVSPDNGVLKDLIPGCVKDIDACSIQKRKLKTLKANEKIALWCEYYYYKYQMRYPVTPRDAAMLKHAEVHRAMLEAFFNSNQWFAKPKTVATYVRNVAEFAKIAKFGEETRDASKKTKGSPTKRERFAAVGEEIRRKYSNSGKQS